MSNFWLRTLTSVAFVVIMVTCILFSPYLCGALLVLVMVVAMQEFYSMSMGGNYLVARKLALLTAVTFFTTFFCHEAFGLDIRSVAAGIIPLIATVIYPVFMKHRPEFGMFAYIFVGLLYIGAPICLIPSVLFAGGSFDGTLLLLFFILIWISDAGAYCLGTLFGQKPDSRKLAPSISPKKSWWGFWSGVITSTAAAVALHYMGFLCLPVIHCAVLGVIISCGGVCGDLFESLWKRFFGVKDSGKCIPGHGGMLDRFDSSLVALPLAIVYLTIFGLI